jgi:hypothetical protein
VHHSYLLRVPAICNSLVLIVLQGDVPDNAVWDILNNVPLDRELAIPSVILPVINTLVKIDRPSHLSYTAELTTAINLQRNSYKFISHLEHSDQLLAKTI